MMDSPTESFDRSQIVEDRVALVKMVEKKRDGLVISYSVNTEEDSPIAVRVRDPLPPEKDIRDKGFHPEHRPRNWGFEDNELVFEDVVSADEDVYVVFGIVLAEDREYEGDLPDPRIDAAQPIESSDGSGISSDMGVPLFRNSTLTGEEDGSDGMPGLDADSEEGEPGQTETTGTTSGVDAEEQPPGVSVGESAEATADDAASPEGEAGSAIEEIDDESDTLAADDGPIESSPDTSSTAPGAEPSINEDDAEERDQPAILSDIDEATDSGSEPQASEPASAESTQADSVLSSLLDELESGELSDEELELIREQFGLKPSRAMEVRMRHLESKMGNFSAYTDALEGFINEHGEASEFITDIQRELSNLEASLAETRQDIEHERSERSRVDDQLQQVREAVDGLEDRLDQRIERLDDDISDRVESRIEQAEAEFKERLEDDVRGIEERFENRLDDIDERLKARQEKLESVELQLDEVEGDLEARLGELQEEYDERDQQVDDRFSKLEESVSELSSTIDDIDAHLDESVAEVRSRVDTVDEQVDETRDVLEAEIEDVRGEVDKLERMRSVFAEAFGEATLEEDADAEEAASDEEQPESE